jgi:hypothetical protein
MTVIRSLWAGTGNHTPATYEANSGLRTLGFPAAGRSVSDGLQCEVDNLPTFVVLPDSRALPTGVAKKLSFKDNWTHERLPASPYVFLRRSGRFLENPEAGDRAPASNHRASIHLPPLIGALVH